MQESEKRKGSAAFSLSIMLEEIIQSAIIAARQSFTLLVVVQRQQGFI